MSSLTFGRGDEKSYWIDYFLERALKTKVNNLPG